MVQVPLPTAVTVPSAATVATAALLEVQLTLELVPETFSGHLSPAKARVKSSRLRVRPEEDVPEFPLPEGVLAGAEVAAEPSNRQRKIQLFSPAPATVAVMVAVPGPTAVTTPFQDTEATLGLLDFHVTSPRALAGVYVIRIL